MQTRLTTRSLFSRQQKSDEESEHVPQSSALSLGDFFQHGEECTGCDPFWRFERAALSRGEFQRDFEIDDLQLSSSSSAYSSILNRPPSYFAGSQSSSSGELRYPLLAPSGTAAIAFDVPPATPPVAAANSNNVVQDVVTPAAAAPSKAPANPVAPTVAPLLDTNYPLGEPAPTFGVTALGTDFLPEYEVLVLPSSALTARFLARVSISDLEVGHAVLILGFAAGIVSAATFTAPIVAYLVVTELPDGSVDAVRAFPTSTSSMANYPSLVTFIPWVAVDRPTVIILNAAGVRARCLPTLVETAKLFQVALVGGAVTASLSAIVTAASMLYDTPESQLKREAREEKLAAVHVCMRGDLAAANAFIGPARDLSNDAVLARTYPLLTVAQRTCPWARPECLPLFLQFLV